MHKFTKIKSKNVQISTIQETQGEVLALFLHHTLQPRGVRRGVRLAGQARHVLREVGTLEGLPKLSIGGGLTQGVQVEAQGAWRKDNQKLWLVVFCLP